MKQTYINPEQRVIKLMACQQMMAGSVTTLSIGGDVENTSGACGRDFDFDDEE